jgi:hypothetical protein
VPAVANRALPATPFRIQAPANAHNTIAATSTSVEVTMRARCARTVIRTSSHRFLNTPGPWAA